MADVKISALPAATTPVAGTEVLPIVQSGTTKKLTIADVTAGRAMSASSLTLTSPLAVASGGTGVTTSTGTGSVVLGTSPTFTTSAIFPAGTVGAPGITTTGDTNTGIYFPAADTIGFVEGGVEAMRLDASGNLGLGATPSAWGSFRAIDLQGSGAIASYTAGTPSVGLYHNAYFNGSNYVYKSDGNAQYIDMFGANGIRFFQAASGTAGNAISFTQAMTLDASGNLGIGTSSPAAYGKFAVQGAGSVVNMISTAAAGNCYQSFFSNSGSTNLGYIGFGSANNTDLIIYANQANSKLDFYTSAALAARIDSSGNLLVGTTTNNTRAPRLALNGNSVTWSVGPSASNSTFVVYNASEAGVYMGDGSTSWSSSSDERLKNITGNITDAINKIVALRSVNFTWKSDSKNIPRVGLVAQDVQKVLPEAVSENDGYLGVSYTDVIPLAVAAIKELAAKVTALEEQLNG